MSPAQVVKDWWEDTARRRIGLLTAAMVLVLTAMHFGEVMEPYWISTRGYTRVIIQAAEKSMSSRLLSLEIASKEADRNATQSQIDRVEAELAKLPAGTNETLRGVLADQLVRYRRQLELLDFELNDLRRSRAGQRP